MGSCKAKNYYHVKIIQRTYTYKSTNHFNFLSCSIFSMGSKYKTIFTRIVEYFWNFRFGHCLQQTNNKAICIFQNTELRKSTIYSLVVCRFDVGTFRLPGFTSNQWANQTSFWKWSKVFLLNMGTDLLYTIHNRYLRKFKIPQMHHNF